MNFCIAEGLLPERVTRRLEMPKRDRKVIAVFTRKQIDSLFAACERPGDMQYPWLAERDKTILMLLLDTGMRASELCGLTLNSVHLEHGVARDDAYLTVMGKGRRQRECPWVSVPGVRCTALSIAFARVCPVRPIFLWGAMAVHWTTKGWARCCIA